jgi:hypothetical protein
MLSPASSTMIFMGRLQFNAPVSAAAMVRNLSNLVPAPAFQPMKITASVFDMRHAITVDPVHGSEGVKCAMDGGFG